MNLTHAFWAIILATMSLFSVVVGAQEAPAEEVPLVEDAEGKKAYQDVEKLHKLESSALKARTPVGGVWRPSLLAPHAGKLATLRREFQIEKPPEPAVGAAIIGVPKVRARFENTQVLGLTEHDQPSVRAYLDFFDGRGKRILANWMVRMGKYETMIRATLKEEGLPEDLIYVAMIESGFSPRATSPAAAVGVWQFIPTTGSEMGLTIDAYVDERRDPVKATRAACDYLGALYERFGSWPLALAAYNGGPGLVSKTIRRFNSNDYWFIQRHGGLYDETRRYVPKILAAGLVTKNYDLFGFSDERAGTFEFDLVEVPANTRLAVFAKAAGTSVKELRSLNPELLRPQTPPGTKYYPLRIPKGTQAKFVAAYDKVPAQALAQSEYTTLFGETLIDVARKFQMPPRVIRVANGLDRRERVPYGTTLIIPEASRGTWKSQAKKGPSAIIVPRQLPNVAGAERKFYRVEAMDTLAALSRAAGVKFSDIVVWNYLDPQAKLQPGLVLQLYAVDGADFSGVELMDASSVSVVVAGSAAHKKLLKKTKKRSRRFYHRVKSGQSLWIIAKKYRVTVEDLKRWNRSLRKSNMLQPGQKIVVYPGKRKRKKRRR